MPTGTWSVNVVIASEYWSRPSTVTIEPGRTAKATVSYPDPSGITLHVRDTNGRTVYGFDMYIFQSDPHTGRRGTQIGVWLANAADRVGEGRLLILSEGTFEVMIGHADFVTGKQIVTLADGVVHHLEFVMERSQ